MLAVVNDNPLSFFSLPIHSPLSEQTSLQTAETLFKWNATTQPHTKLVYFTFAAVISLLCATWLLIGVTSVKMKWKIG